jgi:hypothetical protein
VDATTEGLDTNPERVAYRKQTIAVVEEVFADGDAEPLLDQHGDAVRAWLGSDDAGAAS